MFHLLCFDLLLLFFNLLDGATAIPVWTFESSTKDDLRYSHSIAKGSSSQDGWQQTDDVELAPLPQQLGDLTISTAWINSQPYETPTPAVLTPPIPHLHLQSPYSMDYHHSPFWGPNPHHRHQPTQPVTSLSAIPRQDHLTPYGNAHQQQYLSLHAQPSFWPGSFDAQENSGNASFEPQNNDDTQLITQIVPLLPRAQRARRPSKSLIKEEEMKERGKEDEDRKRIYNKTKREKHKMFADMLGVPVASIFCLDEFKRYMETKNPTKEEWLAMMAPKIKVQREKWKAKYHKKSKSDPNYHKDTYARRSGPDKDKFLERHAAYERERLKKQKALKVGKSPDNKITITDLGQGQGRLPNDDVVSSPSATSSHVDMFQYARLDSPFHSVDVYPESFWPAKENSEGPGYGDTTYLY